MNNFQSKYFLSVADCFERIALEAMLPFEKTFRTEDTNSLKMCKERCLQAGEKCQAISFG